MIQRILVSVDGSPLAEQALSQAAAIAHAFDSEIHLLRVQEPQAATGGFSASTPIGEEIYVEQLLSQERNEAISITSDAPSTVLEVGKVYNFTLTTQTATQGYEQLSTQINFPNNIFHIVEMTSTYTSPASTANGIPYADACGWENNPSDPEYLQCVGPCL